MKINHTAAGQDFLKLEEPSYSDFAVRATFDEARESFVTHTVLFSAICLLFVISTFLNTLFLIIYLRKASLRNISNRFIVSLTVGNLLATFVLLPVTITDAYLTEQHLEGGQTWPYICKTFNVISDMSISASILATLLIAMDRFLAITDPLHYHMLVTKGRSCFLIGFTWVLAAFVGLASGGAKFQSGEWNACLSDLTEDSSERSSGSIVFAVLNFLFVFLLPLVSLSWAYSNIYKAAQQNSERNRRSSVCLPSLDYTGTGMDPKNVSRSSSTRSTSSQLVSNIKRRISNASLFLYREEARAAKISAVVIVLFVVCWAPFYTIQVGSARLQPGTVPNAFSKFALLLAMSNSAVSPYINIYRSKRIQKEVFKFFGIRLKKKNSAPCPTRRLTYHKLPTNLRLPPGHKAPEPHFYLPQEADNDGKTFFCTIFRSPSPSPKSRRHSMVVSSSCSSSGVSTDEAPLPTRFLDEHEVHSS